MNQSTEKTKSLPSSEKDALVALHELAAAVDQTESSSSAKDLVKKVRILLKDNQEILNFKTTRLAITGNITLQPLKPYLEAECLRAKIDPVFFFGGYDYYIHEMAQTSSELYHFQPNMTFLFLAPQTLLPELYSSFFKTSPETRLKMIADKMEQTKVLVEKFIENSNSILIVSEFVPPRLPRMGIHNLREPVGERAVIRELNDRLAEWEDSSPNRIFRLDSLKVLAECGWTFTADEKMRHLAKMAIPEKALPYLAKEILRYIRPAVGLTKKCLVLDLDNTLWGGVLGEDGIEGIQLGTEPPGNVFVEFQEIIRDLQCRGVILAINSKNDFEFVREVFDKHPDMKLKLSDFACIRANWNDKAQNMREIAQELNISLDTFVYMDDNPAERLLVRQQLPEILTVEMPEDFSDYARTLLDLDVFEVLTLTQEDRKRTKLYQAEIKRKELKTIASDLGEYLKSLEITVDIHSADAFAIPRIAQLTQRTNQFNLTTRRYKEVEIKSFAESPIVRVYYIKSSDRFGDHGIVGTCVVRIQGNIWDLDSLLLSCRVVGRGIEQAFLHNICLKAIEEGAVKLTSCYIPTRKNNLVSNFYSGEKFVIVSQTFEKTIYELDLKQKTVPLPDHINLRTFNER